MPVSKFYVPSVTGIKNSKSLQFSLWCAKIDTIFYIHEYQHSLWRKIYELHIYQLNSKGDTWPYMGSPHGKVKKNVPSVTALINTFL